MFLLIHKLIGDLDLQKQSPRIDLVCRSRLLVLACLQEIGAIARAIQSHFPLLAAALRADAPVYRRAKAFFLANFTDSATQSRWAPSKHYVIRGEIPPRPRGRGSTGRFQIADCRFQT